MPRYRCGSESVSGGVGVGIVRLARITCHLLVPASSMHDSHYLYYHAGTVSQHTYYTDMGPGLPVAAAFAFTFSSVWMEGYDDTIPIIYALSLTSFGELSLDGIYSDKNCETLV